MSREAEYHSKDFEWNQLSAEIEGDPSLLPHLLPFDSDPANGVSRKPHNSSTYNLQDDSIAWNSFHIRHSTGKFFKERRYLLKEFPELASCSENAKVLEVGCGNGSTALPILRGNASISVYACDCSIEALERTKEVIAAANIISAEHRFHPFYCDLSVRGFPEWLACSSCKESFSRNQQDVQNNGGRDLSNLTLSNECSSCIYGVDFITLIFTLSAVPLHGMPKVIAECFSVLKPGGLLLFRDYGLYDMTMLRLELGQRVGFREYMRSDGTRSYFFCLDTVRDLFTSAGFTELELEYCCVKSVNRRNGKNMRRVWVHAKFQKPM